MHRSNPRNPLTEIEIRHLLVQTFLQHEFPLTRDQQDQFVVYWRELRQWNSRINLTSIRCDREMVLKHFLDSLGVLQHFRIKAGDSVIDIGSGAGFPGIPLKIYIPDIELTLVEATSKKASFLRFLLTQLNIPLTQPHVKVAVERAEVFAKQRENLRAYDWVLNRYVRSLADSVEYCVPLLKRDGTWIAYKQEKVEDEVQIAMSQFQRCGGKLESVVKSQIPGLNRTYVATRALPINV